MMIFSFNSIFSLDPELKDELVSIIAKLLADKTIVSIEKQMKRFKSFVSLNLVS